MVQLIEWIQGMEPTSVEHKAVYTSCFVPRYAELIYELFLGADCHERCQEPAITSTTLVNVLGGCSINEELRIVEDILNPLDPRGSINSIDSLVTSILLTKQTTNSQPCW